MNLASVSFSFIFWPFWVLFTPITVAFILRRIIATLLSLVELQKVACDAPISPGPSRISTKIAADSLAGPITCFLAVNLKVA